MFRIYLRVVSHRLEPESVTSGTGLIPDRVTRVGESLSSGSRRRRFNSWEKHVADPESGAARVEDVEDVLVGWGDEAAVALGKLGADPDVTVSLVIVQRIDAPEDSTQTGIPLGEHTVAWLARAGASIDIDQYVVVPEP